ncbi:MAG: recombination mediator RecR [Erysipelotrichaceae bacterium]|jgi:recombination protein RecR|nr:recombination mediator RecR [Erysipelotrichaceae bacterium]
MKELSVINALIDSISALPSIGKKTAERIAYALLDFEPSKIKEIGENIASLPLKIKRCAICGGYSLGDSCEICQNPERNHQFMMVVHEPKDIFLFEKTNAMKGIYFVLDELLKGSKPTGKLETRINLLKNRIQKEKTSEILLATPMSLEGQTTALYLQSFLKTPNLKITRLAYGLPFGSMLEYVDTITLKQAVIARIKMGEE